MYVLYYHLFVSTFYCIVVVVLPATLKTFLDCHFHSLSLSPTETLSPINQFSLSFSSPLAPPLSQSAMEEEQHPTTPFLHHLSTTTPMEEPPPSDASSSSEWGYSKPVVFLDVIWNLAFVLVSAVLLLSTLRERPSTPLRIWIAGYALQCLFHVGFVYFEYKRRNRTREARGAAAEPDGVDARGNVNELFTSSPERRCQSQTSVVKRLESANTIVSFVWWMIGFYWIVVGGQALLQDAPRLYWLAVVFLAFDVFFAIFCILLACIVGVALCCCLPCIVAILYAVAVREGATEDDISLLPRYRYRQPSQPVASNLDRRPEVAVPILEPNCTSEITLQPEDSECCICLSQYVDGVELHRLPCNHHFHRGCVTKWLRINATCPLCKYNILNADELV